VKIAATKALLAIRWSNPRFLVVAASLPLP
jgi:hypothetical protein